MPIFLRRRGAAAAAVFCAATFAVAYLWSSRPARAAFTPDPYQVTHAVDTDPNPDVVETTIPAQAAAVDIGGGTLASVLTYNGTLPGPEFRLKVGDTVIVHFVNNIAHDTGIHWHGIELANASDGTPLTQNQVVPGGTFLYKFKVTRPGAYWYHPHHHSSTNQVFKGPQPNAHVSNPFSVVGWALSEWGSPGGSGVSTLHVWAYPAAGGSPRFVGASSPVGPRPDVAAILGGQFATSGFTVNAASLPAGTYDLAVFAFNERTATVTDRRLVRIVVQ